VHRPQVRRRDHAPRLPSRRKRRRGARRAAPQQLYELWERQQVDEARHARFFSRFYDTVFSIGGGMDAQLQEVRAELNEFAFNALSRRLKVIGVGLPG